MSEAVELGAKEITPQETWVQYEYEKALLRKAGLTPEVYELQVRALVDKYGV